MSRFQFNPQVLVRSAFLEFYPVAIALKIFGVQLSNWNIVFHSNNKAFVDVINKQRWKGVERMKLMRYMVRVK